MSGQGKNKKPVSLKERVNHMAAVVKQVVTDLTGLAHLHNALANDLTQRMEYSEAAVGRLIDAQAVAFRLIFQNLDIGREARLQGVRELNALKEFASLIKFVAKANKLDSGVPVMQEIVDIPAATGGKAPEGLVQILLAFVSPEEAESMEENADVPVMTLQRGPEVGAVIDGPPPEGTETAATILCHPTAFQPLLFGMDSVERLYMEGMVGIDNPEGFYKFLYSLDLGNYAKAKQEEAELLEQKEAAKKESQVEVDPQALAVSGHPKAAIIFGGDGEEGTPITPVEPPEESIADEPPSELEEPGEGERKLADHETEKPH